MMSIIGIIKFNEIRQDPPETSTQQKRINHYEVIQKERLFSDLIKLL